MRKPVFILLCIFGAVFLINGLIHYFTFEYSYFPSQTEAAEPIRVLTAQETSEEEFPVTDELIAFGRKAFYTETFGNEVFFTDILGTYDGALTLPNVFKACLKLRGQGTNNLQVEAAKTVVLGDRTIHKGELIDTGLDVAKGAYTPLGITLKVKEGRLQAGLGCVTCHAIADLPSGKILEGVPNTDLNAGLLLALGTNSASFFTHTDVNNLTKFIKDTGRTVPGEDGSKLALPDPDALEKAVDRDFLTWPPGYVDTMIDLKNSPVQIPDSFTKGDHPYTWSGSIGIGPFHGLAFFNGIPNAQNMDPLSQMNLSKTLFGLDKEVYVGTLLQRAANEKYRYRPESGEKPSAFLDRVDPTPGAPGVNELVPTPNYPRPSPVSITGLLASKPGYPVAYHLLAMAAYQNALHPPPSKHQASDAQRVSAGRDVFRRANCISCHAGTYLTNNSIVPSSVIGTEPTRSIALRSLEPAWDKPLMYPWDTPVPLPARPNTFEFDLSRYDPEQLRLSLGQGGREGGYKVPSLFGLYWSAPYLHDGGVAVGAEGASQAGIPGTLHRGVAADPANSLRALVDRRLRRQVITANEADPDVIRARITGAGHEYWVDEEAGFTQEQQDALIDYLLKVNDRP
ncbi:electron transport protein [Paenibacillus sp. GD4]|uniref:electron transport protein n=1 Tax=Paenibacillus sp. GD4 TaxID=3068890 RepID=UPI002796812C|nr:electron transport protein [Paenibacillus sp. GD4]MDQ1911754.1 electron transport protein [Paenibacillus sp. GD4]